MEVEGLMHYSAAGLQRNIQYNVSLLSPVFTVKIKPLWLNTQHTVSTQNIAKICECFSLNPCVIKLSPGGTILQNSVEKMCSVQMMASAVMGCGEPTVRACLDSQEAGDLLTPFVNSQA